MTADFHMIAIIVELELKSVTASYRLRSLRLLENGLKSGSHMIDSSLIATIVATIEKQAARGVGY